MTLLREGARAEAAPAAAPPDAIELPIRTTSSGFWSGEIRVDGVSKPLNFIIDTGATISVVSENLMSREELGRFAQEARLRVYGAAGITEDVRTLLLPSVMLGSHVRSNVTAAVLDLNPINETAGFEQTGIIGGNVLRYFRITFDFGRAILRLEPLVPVPAPAGTAMRSGPVGKASMKQSIYLETSVVGAYLDNGEPFRRDLTIRWWEH